MKKVTLFIQQDCPFCKMALSYIFDLKRDSRYDQISVEVVDEQEEVERADAHDYYFVPTFYLDDKKLHEGAIYKSEVESLFESILLGD